MSYNFKALYKQWLIKVHGITFKQTRNYYWKVSSSQHSLPWGLNYSSYFFRCGKAKYSSLLRRHRTVITGKYKYLNETSEGNSPPPSTSPPTHQPDLYNWSAAMTGLVTTCALFTQFTQPWYPLEQRGAGWLKILPPGIAWEKTRLQPW